MIKKSNIAIVCPSCGGEGAVGNVAVHQARELTRYFRVILLSDSFPKEVSEDVECCLLSPARFDCLRRYCHVPNEFAFVVSAKKALEKINRQRRLTAVLCHGHAVAAFITKTLKEKYGSPTLMVIHGDIFERPLGTYDPRVSWFYRRVTPRAYQSVSMVIVLAPHMKDFAVRGGADPNIVQVIPNGLDPNEIGLSESTSGWTPPEKGEQIRLLYVGRLSVEKGADVLLEACTALLEQEINFHLDIIGTGPELDNYQKFVMGKELESSVTFSGPLPRRNLGAIYRSAHLVCVPSRDDSLPTVVIESLLAGVPVVGTKVGGIPFLLAEGKRGYLVDRGNPLELAKMIVDCRGDIDTLSKFSSLGQQFVSQQLSWRKNGRSIYSAVNSILDQ